MKKRGGGGEGRKVTSDSQAKGENVSRQYQIQFHLERLSYPGEIGNSGREKCLDGKQAVKNGECF